MAETFQRYDYEDAKLNLHHYGQLSPPTIDVSQIKVPVAIMVGVSDTLATLADNMDLRKKLDPESLFFFKSYEADHVSLILGKDTDIMNKDLLDLLKHSSSTVPKPEQKSDQKPDPKPEQKTDPKAEHNREQNGKNGKNGKEKKMGKQIDLAASQSTVTE